MIRNRALARSIHTSIRRQSLLTPALYRIPHAIVSRQPHIAARRHFSDISAQDSAQKPGWVNPDAVPQGEWLKKFGTDLTEMAKEHKLDPVIGRDKEVLRVLQILSRRTKNNPILVGEAGTGKTAVAQEIAQRIHNGDVPESLKRRRVISLDLATVAAGAKYQGEWEERLTGILKDVTDAKGEVILFIDEIHQMVSSRGGGDTMSAANIMKPALARGDLHCVGATTLDEYRKYFEKDAALTRRFQPVLVDEPNLEDTISILRGLKEKFELHHGVRIHDNAIISAAMLADRYVSDRRQPDKSVDLIDEAASRLRLQQESKPEPIWNLERELIKKKIEFEAIRREDDEASKLRKVDIEGKVAELEANLKELNDEWDREKAQLTQGKDVKEQLERLKRELEVAERQGNYERAGELKHSLIPKLEKDLEESEHLDAQTETGKSKLLEEYVTSEHVAQVVAVATGIPAARLEQGERERLMGMEDELKKRVVGQDPAVESVANLIRQSKAGLRSRNRPLGSFLMLGPTGVGKTELCKTLAQYLFDDESSMLRIDMSEYQERHTAAKLLGAPAGYVGYEDGGILTNSVRRRPYQVILFDEFEKAHREVGNILLQVLDDGRLTDSQGRLIDFRNTIIVMTSNLGSHAYDDPEADDTTVKQRVMDSVRAYMAPELLNRIDEVCMFNKLTRKDMDAIVVKELAQTQGYLKQDRDVVIETTPELRTWIADVGFDPRYGARPLRRAIQHEILNPLSKHIIDGSIKDGALVRIGLNKEVEGSDHPSVSISVSEQNQ